MPVYFTLIISLYSVLSKPIDFPKITKDEIRRHERKQIKNWDCFAWSIVFYKEGKRIYAEVRYFPSFLNKFSFPPTIFSSFVIIPIFNGRNRMLRIPWLLWPLHTLCADTDLNACSILTPTPQTLKISTDWCKLQKIYHSYTLNYIGWLLAALFYS